MARKGRIRAARLDHEPQHAQRREHRRGEEEAEVRRNILEIDPRAFIITHDPIRVTGGYQKRLDI